MWQLYNASAQDIIAQREAEAEAIRIERLVSRGVDPFADEPYQPGALRRGAATFALAVSRRAGMLARSLDAGIARRPSR
jgi:hypothetical protein